MNKYFKGIIFGSGLLWWISNTYAAGFAVKETSGKHVGQAFAGMAAIRDDVSTIWNNPACAAYIDGKASASTSFAYVMPFTKFIPDAQHTADGSLAAKSSESALIPSIFGAIKISDDINIGLAVTAPFGMKISYGEGSKVRLAAINSSLKVINVNLLLSYKLNNKIALGFGFNTQHADVALSRNKAGKNDTPIIKIQGKDWGFGYNLGMIYNHNNNLTFGISYRSMINYKLKGKISSDNASREATAKFTTPDSLDLSVNYQINDDYSLLASVVFTRWSHFYSLNVQSQAIPIPEEIYDWKNSFFYSVGMNYRANDYITLKFGLAYDETPVNELHRTPLMPDNNRTWVSCGIDYKIADNLELGISFANLFIQDIKINKEVTYEQNKQYISGIFNNKARIVGFSLRANY